MTNDQLIEEYKHQIDLLKKEQENVSFEQKRLRDKWGELNQEIYKLEKNINAIEADMFREECKKGLHKELKFKDLPNDLSWELTQIEDEISDGCNGDWEVGCRGCVHECARKAREKFMKKYNIEKLTY